MLKILKKWFSAPVENDVSKGRTFGAFSASSTSLRDFTLNNPQFIRPASSPTWLSCVKTVVDAFSEVRFVVHELEDGVYQPRYAHPLSMFLDQPNGFQSSNDFWSCVLSEYFKGEAFILFLVDDDAVVPSSLQSVLTSQVQDINGRDNQPITHRQVLKSIGFGGKEYKALQFLHLRMSRDESRPARGIDVGRVFQLAFLAERRCDVLVSTILSNATIRSTIVAPEKGMEFVDSDVHTLKAKIDEQKANGSASIVVSQPLEIHEFGADADSLNTLDNTYGVVSRICTIFNMDPSMIGVGFKSSGYNTQDTVTQRFYANVVFPLFNVVISEFKRVLLPDAPNFRIIPVFNVGLTSGGVRASAVTTVVNLYKAKIIDRAEARMMLSLPVRSSDIGVYFNITQVSGIDASEPDPDKIAQEILEENK